jgi:hypothetical protein
MHSLARIVLAALGAIVSLGITIYLSPANIPGSDAGDCSRNVGVAVSSPSGKPAQHSTALRAPLVSAAGSARRQALPRSHDRTRAILR